MLQAWRERLVKLLAGQNWRVGRPFRSQPLIRTDRRWGPRLIHPGPNRGLKKSHFGLLRLFRSRRLSGYC